MKINQIPCQFENHFKMPFEYICMNPQCRKNSQQLCCIYCCQQTHSDHLSDVQALKMIINEFKNAIKETQFGAGSILLNGISKCRNQRDLRQNVAELVNFNIGGLRFEKIIDRNHEILKNQTKNFYEGRNDNSAGLKSTVKKQRKPALQSETAFITPILTFSADDAVEQGFILKSPFCVVNSTQKLVTAFAYPALNRFQDSIEIDIKIERMTPFWVGLGISQGKKRYEPNSKDHLIIMSNGWISNLGMVQRTYVKYCTKDRLKLKYDKRMQLVQFMANNQKHSINYNPSWNQQIHICCILFYKDDSVQIMA